MFDTDALLQMSWAEAELFAHQNGCTLRKVWEDGVPLVVTMEYQLNRINVCVTDGVIVEVQDIG